MLFTVAHIMDHSTILRRIQYWRVGATAVRRGIPEELDQLPVECVAVASSIGENS